jgi:hypothetical protein
MMSAHLRIALIAALAGAGPALAEEAVAPSAAPIRVSVSTTINVDGSTATIEESVAANAKARTVLYQIASKECKTLKTVFNADCQLVQIQVNAREQRVRADTVDGVAATGTFSFSLTTHR